MKKTETDMRPEYKRSDFAKLERGKFFAEVAKGSSVAILNPEIAKAFPSSEAVNAALQGLLTLTEQTARLTARPKRSPSKGARLGA
jgi:hypothetical protein